MGNEVIVTGRRKAVLDELKATHPALHTIQSDVADPAQIAALAARVKPEFPRLDVLLAEVINARVFGGIHFRPRVLTERRWGFPLVIMC